MTKKVQDYFLNELEVDRFTVKALKTKNLVTTFKVKKMSDYTNKTLEEIYQFLNEDSRPDTGQSITKGGKEVDFAKEYGIYTREQEIEQMQKEQQQNIARHLKPFSLHGRLFF